MFSPKLALFLSLGPISFDQLVLGSNPERIVNPKGYVILVSSKNSEPYFEHLIKWFDINNKSVYMHSLINPYKAL